MFRHHAGRVTVLALIAGLLFAAPGQAAAREEPGPTALYTLTSGAIGNYTYSLQVGPGVGFLDEPAVCISTVFTHVGSADPVLGDECRRRTSRSKLVSRREILEVNNSYLTSNGDTTVALVSFGATPRADRLKLFWDTKPTVKINRGSSKVLKFDNERIRFFYRASLDNNPLRPDRIKAQDKVCRKVKGKSKGKGKGKGKKCTWKTVADRPYFLLP